MDSRSLTIVSCGSDGLDADVAETVEVGVFFFPNQFIVVDGDRWWTGVSTTRNATKGIVVVLPNRKTTR
jgi:hypothetical protein